MYRVTAGSLLWGIVFLIPATILGQPAVRVVIWDKQQPAQKQAYDNFLGNEIAAFLKDRPGHETYPAYKNEHCLAVIENAVRWLGSEIQR